MRRSIASEEARAFRSSVGSNSLLIVHRSAFAAQTQSFLYGKFSIARLEVLPNLRHVRVFQISTMVNLGIGFQEPLTRPSVKLDQKMSNYSQLYSSDSEWSRGIYPGYTNSSLLESDLKVRKCHAIPFLRAIFWENRELHDTCRKIQFFILLPKHPV